MPEHFYIVIEIQIAADGTKGLLNNFYMEDSQQTNSAKNRAYSKYFTVCAAAAISAIPYHAAMMIRSDGAIIEENVWDRRE